MIKEYHTQFVDRLERTPTIISYRFNMPKGLDFTAGQYMLVNLGHGLVHPLSLSSCPEHAEIIEFTKRMTDSPYSRRLKSLKKGETVSVKGPYGKFCLTSMNENVVMIAGGIGITPFISILSSLKTKKTNIGSVILIYGNMNREDIAFRHQLENLQIPNYRLVHVLSDTTGLENAYKGFIDADIILKEVPNLNNALFMVSGPPVMVKAINNSLFTINVSQDRIRTDIFLGYN